ncbi:MAG: DUF1289 domain-containing protein [Pseudomonadota bacterium]
MAKVPSPCVDICKYKRQGHCIACSMTKAQKALFKELRKDKHRIAFIQMLIAQQNMLEKYDPWAGLYKKKCERKKRPLDKLGLNLDAR